MDLLVDFINEHKVIASASDQRKIEFNVGKMPDLAAQIRRKGRDGGEAFSIITVIGRWLVIYMANLQDNGNTMMHFIDFRIEIDEGRMTGILSDNVIEGLKRLQLEYDKVFEDRLDIVNLKYAPSFSEALIEEWESELCVNFAIALSRLTGWVLHTDAWVNSVDQNENIPEEERITLRIYVADNLDNIFDVRGIMKIQEFYSSIIEPLAIRKAKVRGGSVSTRFYSEEKIFGLPLNTKPDEKKISSALAVIKENPLFLESITKRSPPLIPAHLALKFTYGLCGPFAEALHVHTNLPITALVAIKYLPQFENNTLGYVHSFILHPDGTGEDSWGRQTIQQIAERFGVAKYDLIESAHKQAIDRLKKESAERYQLAFKEAEEAISTFWN